MVFPQFSEQEVIDYIVFKLLSGEATDDEERLYLDHVWNGRIDKDSHIYKKLLKELLRVYYYGY